MRLNLGNRAQSAMEYLMTYGWAILVILVVLGILYLLHVFGNPIGTTCIVSFKFLCQSPVLSTNGTISVLIGQNTGMDFYNVNFACTASTNSTSGGPFTNGTTPWYYVNSTGALLESYNSSNTYTLASSSKYQINDLPCFGTTGTLLEGVTTHRSNVVYSFFDPTTSATTVTYTTTSVNTTTSTASTTLKAGPTIPIGTQFSGTLWVRYTRNAGTPGSSGNPWNIAQIAYVTTSVTAS